MIHAQIVAISRNINFETGKDSASLTVRLPGGICLEAPVSLAQLPTILELLTAEQGKNEEAAVPIPAPKEESVAAIEEEEQVAWAGLPDEILANDIKHAMADQRLPPYLSLDKVYAIRDAILTEYTDEDWAALEAKVAGQLPPQEALNMQPAVTWQEGSPRMPDVRSRTVAPDAGGNPIVPQVRQASVAAEGVDVDGDGGVPEV